MSKLIFRYGSMGSTKSLNLLTTAYNLEENDISILCLKPSIDTRDGFGQIVTRMVGLDVKRPCVAVQPTDDIFEIVYLHIMNVDKELKYVLIDECQFLKSKQIDQLSKLVDTMNIEVICFGLRTDFTSRLFEGSRRLFEIADNIEEITSYCQCGNKTIINARLSEDGNIVLDGEQILLGSSNELYLPLCRGCWGKI